MYSGYSFYNRQIASNVSQVNDPNAAYRGMEPHWILLEDLIAGGTFEVRRRHRKYLPQAVREQDDSYDRRLATSVVPPFVKRIELMLAGMFAYIFVLTSGGPGSSTYLPEFLIWTNMGLLNKPGYASAIGTLIFCLFIFVILAQVRMMMRRD